MSDELVGRTLGPYRIVEPIGKSGAGRLYKAEQVSMNRVVALKVLPAAFLDDEEFVGNFDEQVGQIARLQHPNIVPLFEGVLGDEYPYLVIGYIDGQNLSERLADHPGGLAAADAARIVSQVAAALDHAHAEGVLHRNVKPANILIDHNGTAFLSNFALSAVSEARSRHAGKQYIGTPAYMAPELSTSREITNRTDIYALGASLFHVLATRPPFDSGNQVAVLLAHVQQPVPTIREYRPDLPIGLQAVIEHVMAKDPASRYATAGEFAAAFQTVVDQMGPAAKQAPQAVKDPLSTVRVEAANVGKTATTVQMRPDKVDLPPLNENQIQAQSAGRRRAAPAPASPPPADPPPADPPPDSSKATLVSASGSSLPTIRGNVHDLVDPRDLTPLPTERETVRSGLDEEEEEILQKSLQSPGGRKRVPLLLIVAIGAGLCLLAAAAVTILIATGILAP